MAETNPKVTIVEPQQAQTQETPEKTPGRIRTYIANHPRATKIAAATAAGLAVVGGIVVAAARSKDDSESSELTVDDNGYLRLTSPTETTTEVAEA